MAYALFLVNKKEVVFFPLLRRKKNIFPRKKKNVNFSWWLKISDKKPMVCHGHFLLCHGQTCRNCHGHFSFFTGIFLAILSRATRQFSRAKFGVFCHGHFMQIHGHFFIKCHGQTENCHGKKNTAGELSLNGYTTQCVKSWLQVLNALTWFLIIKILQVAE